MESPRDGDRQTRFIRIESRDPPRRSLTRERTEPIALDQDFEIHRSRRKHWTSSRDKEATPKISRVRSESGNREDVQNQDDILNDYYGGRTSCRPSVSRPLEYDYIKPEHRPPPQSYSSRIHDGVDYEPAFPPPSGGGGGRPPPPRPPPVSMMDPAWGDDSDEESFITSVSRASSRKGLWPRAAAPASKHGRQLQVRLSLVLSRRGQRYLGAPFAYTQSAWRDADLAAALRDEYRRLKVRRLGPLQKLTSYKTIQFVYFLQYRAVRAPSTQELRGGGGSSRPQSRRHGTWQVTARVPITPNDSAEARSAFMYQLRKPASLRERTNWTDVLDGLIVEGAVVDMDIQETFDSIKIYAALFLSVLLSLGVALAYGFAMDGDFSTGFSIASWMITALGFLGAVIAAGEYFGLERPTAGFNTVERLESGQYVPKDMMPPRLAGYAYR